MAIMNQRLFCKSYMLEFIKNKKTEKVFTFSVPPESEEFQFTHRVTETKTFGGSVFDNYGNDAVHITLSGSTVNMEKKLIYRGNAKLPSQLTGEDEIYEVQELITKWNDIDDKDDKDERKIYLYDLSKMSAVQLLIGQKGGRNWYRVIIKDLKIKRDKSAPYTYRYTLDMLGVGDDDVGKGIELKGILKALDMIMNAADTVKDAMDKVEAAMAMVSSAVSMAKKAYMHYNSLIGASPRKIASTLLHDSDNIISRIFTGDMRNSFYNSAKDCLAVTKIISAGMSHIAGGDGSNWVINKVDSTTQDASVKMSSLHSDTKTKKVLFISNGGSSIKAQKVSWGEACKTPIEPKKEGMQFCGWYTDSTLTIEYDFTRPVEDDITLYAKWSKTSVIVRFNTMGGSDVAQQEVNIGGIVKEPDAPLREGYRFSLWCIDKTGNDAFDFTRSIEDNITLYAKWIKTWKVDFNSSGGNYIESQVVDTGKRIIYPLIPQKSHYTFMRWCIDAGLTKEYDFSETVKSDMTLYAVFIRASNVVTFDTGGGSSIAPVTVALGAKVMPPSPPIWAGHIFSGWYTDIECTNEFMFSSMAINCDTTIYAKWTNSYCTITFDTGGGSTIDSQTVVYGDVAVFPVRPEKDGFMFSGKWLLDAKDNESEFDFKTGIKKDITLYAGWYKGE